MSGTVVEKKAITKQVTAGKNKQEKIKELRLEILRHDIHKINRNGEYTHYTMVSPLKEADITAAAMARTKAVKREDYKRMDNRLRMSHVTCCPVAIKWKLPAEKKMMGIFNHEEPSVIHAKIMQSEGLSWYNESKTYPFTSLKHHLLLACALAENFRETGNYKLKGLKLCLSFDPPGNVYKLVGRAMTKKRGKWTTLYLYLDSEYTGKGNANASFSWKNTWNNIYGFEPETVLLGKNVLAMESWTAALATLENA